LDHGIQAHHAGEHEIFEPLFGSNLIILLHVFHTLRRAAETTRLE
jgi:hypothetical protein